MDPNEPSTSLCPFESSIPLIHGLARRLQPKARAHTYSRITQLPSLPAESGVVLDSATATAVFDGIRLDLERLVSEAASRRSAFDWIRSLRLLPNGLMHTQLRTSDPHDRLVAETFASLGGIDAGGCDGAATEGTLIEALELCALTEALVEVHISLRRAAKGWRFRTRARDLPAPESDSDIRWATELYDSRVASELSNRIAGFDVASAAVDSDLGLLLVLATTPDERWQYVVSWRGPGRLPTEKAWATGRYGIALAALNDIQAINDPVQGRTWCSDELPALVTLLQGLAIDIVFHGRHPTAGLELPVVGFFTTSESNLTRSIDRAIRRYRDVNRRAFGPIAPTDSQAVLAAVRNMQIAPWPATGGPVLFSRGRSVRVDLCAATRRLHYLLTPPSPDAQPDLTNRWAQRFETVTQAVIDERGWRPPNEVLALRARPLRRHGTVVTDIDAIAANGSAMVLIDCKQKSYTLKYDSGDYPAVRNIATELEKAARKWERTVEFLRQYPVGDNYDFTSYDLYGLVITPTVFFVHRGIATGTVSIPGMAEPIHSVASLGELEQALRRS